jgi:hypothetical protein
MVANAALFSSFIACLLQKVSRALLLVMVANMIALSNSEPILLVMAVSTNNQATTAREDP